MQNVSTFNRNEEVNRPQVSYLNQIQHFFMSQSPALIREYNYQLSKHYRKTSGLSRKFRFLLKKMKIIKTNQKCCICQQNFEQNQIVIQLPCKHIFHKSNCINEWLRLSDQCPLCKLDLEIYFMKRQYEQQKRKQEQTKQQMNWLVNDKGDQQNKILSQQHNNQISKNVSDLFKIHTDNS